MRESSKTNQYRSNEFFREYLSGSVLDIGCGPDPVVLHAKPFDLEHGDASRITQYIHGELFDTVYSSHCLEHMENPVSSLAEWWSLVRVGGHMVLVVPHEDLYEQGFWPSLYNSDHKATFRIGHAESWSPVSYDLGELVRSLPSAIVVSQEIHDFGFNYQWRPRISNVPRKLGTFGKFLSRFRHSVLKRVKRSCQDAGKVEHGLNSCLAAIGIPVDQTHHGALAQIQIVAQKTQ